MIRSACQPGLVTSSAARPPSTTSVEAPEIAIERRARWRRTRARSSRVVRGGGVLTERPEVCRSGQCRTAALAAEAIQRWLSLASVPSPLSADTARLTQAVSFEPLLSSRPQRSPPGALN